MSHLCGHDGSGDAQLAQCVDEDGMHRVFHFRGDLCPPDGSTVLRQSLLGHLNKQRVYPLHLQPQQNYDWMSSSTPSTSSSSCSGLHTAGRGGAYRDKEPVDSIAKFVEHYQRDVNNPPLAFDSPQLSRIYRSYEDYLWMLRTRLHDDNFPSQAQVPPPRVYRGPTPPPAAP